MHADILKGTNLTFWRDCPGSVAYYGGYEILNSQLCKFENVERKNLSTLSVLFCGGMAGVLNWLVAVPPDTVKSRFQSAPPGRYPGGAMQVMILVYMCEYQFDNTPFALRLVLIVKAKRCSRY